MTCLALGLVVFALADAAPSFAYVAGAGLVDEPAGGRTLSYVAGAGQVNNVTVELVGTNYVLTDSGVSTFPDADGAAGCNVRGNQATCPQAGVTTIRVDPGDGQDTVAVNPQATALVLARDGVQDTISCAGGGTAAADFTDAVTGCQADVPPDTSLTFGISNPTSNNTPQRGVDFGLDSPDGDTITFECRFDSAAAFGACEGVTLADGTHTLEARAFDGFGPDPTPVSQSFEVDTAAPETAINSGPPAESDSTSAEISFESPSPDAVGFECMLDTEDWRACSSPAAYRGLAVGAHVFSVRAIDAARNADRTAATIRFRVTAAPVSASGPPPGLIVVRPPASFVLIGGSTIKVSRKRIATVTLNCSGNRDCAGELALTTAKRIKLSRKRRRYVRLGAATFFVPAPRSVTVRIPLTKRAFRIVRKRKRIKTMITVTDRDRVGRTRISTREVFLKAR